MLNCIPSQTIMADHIMPDSTRAAAASVGEESLLLRVANLLPEFLLPRLAAADLMRLGLTCRGMLKLVTPPQLWQVAPLPLYHCILRLALGPCDALP